MAISVTCPECFRDYSIPDQYAGKKIKCKGCGAAIRVEADPAVEDDDFDDAPKATPSASGMPPRFGAKPAASVAKRTPKSGTGNTTLYWVLGILGGGALALLLCCGGGLLWVRSTVNDLEQRAANTSPTTPYLQFRAACAGVVNTRNALEFARSKLPIVHPDKIYAAGHSSAGTLSLLAAAHEPRLAGAIAFMPATDLKSRMGDIADVPMSGFLFPKVGDFITQSSPDTHIAAIKSPVFLFHAKDDSNVPFADSKRFADALQAQQSDFTFDFVDFGDHYDAMINDGIPRAIEWLKTRNRPK